mgnify:CR=1 FL=1
MSDQEVRDAALQTHRHLLLQAPAGSGKTTVLAQRFLAALGSVEEPEQVLAITFTRKAAAEMRERVLLALEGRILPEAPEFARWSQLREQVLQQAARRGWSMEELPARLRIQTIDSLCHEIARAMPLLGRMHQSLEVVDDARPAFLEAAAQALRLADEEPLLQADADRLLQRLDNDWNRACLLLADLLPGRNRWLPVLVNVAAADLGERVAASLRRIVGEVLTSLHAVMPLALRTEAAALAQASAMNRFSAAPNRDNSDAAWLRPDTALTTEPAQLAAWQAISDLALRDDGEWRAQVTVNHGFPPADKPLKQRWKAWLEAMQELPDMQQRLQEVRALPSPRVEVEEAQSLAALARLLLLTVAQLKLEFQRRGQVDHAEVAAVARQALSDMGTPTELSVRQTLRVRHLLVDEFQDTSPDQLDLVRELTQGWDDGLVRSLFLVGDPMQSIYLFRNSEVGLFLQVRARGVGDIRLEALQLQRNFRSARPLVEWFNAAFERIFPRTEDIRRSAVTFLRADPVVAGGSVGPVIQVWPQAQAAAGPEAAAIAQEILRIRALQPRWRIAVLVQTRSLAPPIHSALTAAGLCVLGVDLVPLAERPVVRDLISLGRALQDGADRSAWLAVLHAPFCGLTLADLHVLCGEAPDVPVPQCLADEARWSLLGEDARTRLTRIAPLLLRAWEGRGRLDPATALEVTWRQLGGWQACRDATEHSAALQYLAAVRAAAEREGAVPASRLQQLAEDLRDHGAGVGDNAVEILTIHHAKGLEWDVVFVPGLGRKTRGDMPPLLRWLELPAPEGDSDLLLAVRSIGEASASDPLGRYIAGLQAGRQDHERVRLAYVAVTRARHMLVLSGHAPWNRKLQRPVPRRRTALQILWPAIADAFSTLTPPDEEAPSDETRRLDLEMPWYRLAPDFAPTATRVPLQPTGLSGNLPDGLQEPEYDWVGPLARATGTLLHAELERMSAANAVATDEASMGLASRLPYFISRLRESGLPEDSAAEAARRVGASLRRVLQDPRAQWLLAPHRDARSEWRLSGVVDGVLRNAVIDRSFVDGDGNRWVIDYKTGTHGGGSLAEFLAREMERYAPQLRLYRELASRTGPEPVRAALYFPLLGEFRELPD